MMEKIEKIACQVAAIACGIGTVVSMSDSYRPSLPEAFIWLGSYLIAVGAIKSVFAVCSIIADLRKK